MSRVMRPGAVGVLVKTFPKLSETFILGELLSLERLGLELQVFALQRPTDRVLQTAGDALRAPVAYLPAAASDRTLATALAHLRLFARRPRRYLRALFFARRRPEPGAGLDFWQAGWLAARLRRAGVRHLYVHFINRPAGVAELVQRLSGISYSLSAHAKDIYLSPTLVLRRKLAGALFTVTCTEYNRRHLATVGASAPLLRLYHGVDLDRFRPAAGHRAPGGPPLILSVGRLREKKGFRTLIEACSVLTRAGVAYRCYIVGYGPDRAALQRLIQKLGVQDTVVLAGTMAHQQLLERYRQASLFALPCQLASDGDRDGIPNVLLEAMAMQLPVIATPISGIPELIEHRHNGLLVAPQQAEQLAAAAGSRGAGDGSGAL